MATLLLHAVAISLRQYTADPIRVLSGSSNGESCDVSILSVLVSHESHGRKVRGPEK